MFPTKRLAVMVLGLKSAAVEGHDCSRWEKFVASFERVLFVAVDAMPLLAQAQLQYEAPRVPEGPRVSIRFGQRDPHSNPRSCRFGTQPKARFMLIDDVQELDTLLVQQLAAVQASQQPSSEDGNPEIPDEEQLQEAFLIMLQLCTGIDDELALAIGHVVGFSLRTLLVQVQDASELARLVPTISLSMAQMVLDSLRHDAPILAQEPPH